MIRCRSELIPCVNKPCVDVHSSRSSPSARQYSKIASKLKKCLLLSIGIDIFSQSLTLFLPSRYSVSYCSQRRTTYMFCWLLWMFKSSVLHCVDLIRISIWYASIILKSKFHRFFVEITTFYAIFRRKILEHWEGLLLIRLSVRQPRREKLFHIQHRNYRYVRSSLSPRSD